jgi:hypothetical protein
MRRTRVPSPSNTSYDDDVRCGAIAFALIVLAHLAVVPAAGAQEIDAEQLLEQFERALNAHDEDAVTRLFTSDGVVRDHVGGEVITRAQLRGWVSKARESNLHTHLGDYTSTGGTTHFTIEVGQGEWYRDGGTPVRARGTAEVRGTRIVTLTLEPGSRAATTARAAGGEALAGVPLMSIAVVVGGLVALMAGLRRVWVRPLDPSSRPRPGTLHSALGAWAHARRGR